MSLYTSSIFLPPITFPQIVGETDISNDDRASVAEVEAAFDDFESELSVQLFHNMSPIGKRASTFPSSINDFVATTPNNAQRSSVNRVTLGSPFYNDSLNLDSEFNEMDLSPTVPISSRSSGSRLPRRVVRSRAQASLSATHVNFATSVGRRLDHSTTGSMAAFNSIETASNSLIDLAGSSSTESRIANGVGDGDSNDNFLVDEEIAEAARIHPDSVNDSDEAGTVVR